MYIFLLKNPCITNKHFKIPSPSAVETLNTKSSTLLLIKQTSSKLINRLAEMEEQYKKEKEEVNGLLLQQKLVRKCICKCN